MTDSLARTSKFCGQASFFIIRMLSNNLIKVFDETVLCVATVLRSLPRLGLRRCGQSVNFFLWLHDLPVSTLVRESSPVYASIETFHAIGMGILVGTITVVDLRLLGLLKRIPLFMLVNLLPLIWAGFVINACSGSLMFMSDAVAMSTNRIFLTKMCLIFSGFLLALALRRLVFRQMMKGSQGGALSSSAKILAGSSLLVWYGAITAGRLTAYFQ